MEITVVEKNGWKKPARFDKAVVRIGSSSSADVQLSAKEILPYHLQVIQSPENPAVCKVLNLGPAVTLIAGKDESPVEPYATVDVRDGAELAIAGYRIFFGLPLSSGLVLSSRQIAASLMVGDAVLRPETSAFGVLHLKNLGTNPNCQFQLSVNGLPEECYRVDPLPILYPGAEEDVRIQFFHRSIFPLAGHLVITVSVTAPTSYPGEQVIIQQGLYVNPVLKLGIELADDMPVPKAKSLPPAPISPEAEPTLPAAAIAEPTPEPAPDVVENPEPTPIIASPESVAPVQNPPKEIIAAKVVRNPSETYWDENS